jgi:hypothetical protein
MGLLGFFLLLRLCSTVASLAPDTSPAAVEKEMLADDDSAPLFQTIKRTYPDEFEALKKDISARATAGASKTEMATIVRGDVMQALKRHRRDMLQAPHPAFAAYRTAEIAFVDALHKTDTRLCATYAMQGSIEADLDQNFPKKQARDFQQRTWEGYAAGRDNPAHRVIRKPAPAEVRALQSAMAANGLSQQQIRNFFTTGAMRRATTDDQCWIGLGFLRAMNDLPGDRADSIYAYIAQQSPQ